MRALAPPNRMLVVAGPPSHRGAAPRSSAASAPALASASSPMFRPSAASALKLGLATRTRVGRAGVYASGVGFGADGEGAAPKPNLGPPQAPKKIVDPNRPKNCRTAIEMGQKEFEAGEFQKAIDLFLLALELPGQGAIRYPGKPKEYAVPSEGEENAALYNLACSYTALGEFDRALQALEAAFDNSFDQFEAARTDPDLAELRRQKGFDGLIGKYDGMLAKLTRKKDKPNSNKPWLSW